jgi:hypothetical protein
MMLLRQVRRKPRQRDQQDEQEAYDEDPELERRVPSNSDALEAVL